MDGLTKSLSIIFAVVALLLVAVITVANRLSLVIILKRSLVSSLLFGMLGGVIGYLVNNMTTMNKQLKEINSVSKETAAQQYAAQKSGEAETSKAKNKNQEEDEDQQKDEFQPLDLEEIDYDEQQEVEELAEQDPEKLAKMVKNIQEE